MAFPPVSPERTSHRHVRLVRRLLSSFVLRALSIPGTSALVHRTFYRLLASGFGPDAQWHFMNYGFDSAYFRAHPLELRRQQDPDRFSIQLYHHLLSPLAIAGSTVLEIGCGRGGGVAYIARDLQARRTVGIDLCHESVKICRTNHHGRHIAFLTGDAHRLPFRDASFDAVVNVESSHAYASMPDFLDEVRRVLRPGGSFVLADLRWNMPCRASRPGSGLLMLRQQLLNCGLVLVDESDLSSGVLRARTADDERQRTAIRELVPPGLRSAFAELAGLPGTMMHRRLAEHDLIYWSCVLQKPTDSR